MLTFLALVMLMLKFNVPRRRAGKATLQVKTGAIDGWWRRAKDSIPPSLRFLGMAKSILRFSNVFNKRYAWRWEHTGTNLMAEMGQQVDKLSFGA